MSKQIATTVSDKNQTELFTMEDRLHEEDKENEDTTPSAPPAEELETESGSQ